MTSVLLATIDGYATKARRKPRIEPSQRGRFCDDCQRWFPEGYGPHICIPRAKRSE